MDEDSNFATLTENQLKDKLMGMLLLGGYGDALGAPHELSGGARDGNIGDPDSVRQLPPFRDYGVSAANLWGVWFTANTIDADKRGVPTDDTAYRVAILRPWLCQLAGQSGNRVPAEPDFQNWMHQQTPPAAGDPPWQSQQHGQILNWIVMFGDAVRLEVDPDNFVPSPGNAFFREDTPIIFGPFLYLELGAVYAGRPEQEVFELFRDFTRLDQAHGKFVSGLMMAMMSRAVMANPGTKSFGDWYLETADRILAAAGRDVNQRETIKTHFADASNVGSDNRDLNEADFLTRLKQDVYLQPLPPPADDLLGDFRRFDSLLFLKMMAAVVGYSGDDVRMAVRLLAVAPGDSDTMASQLASLIGAWSGAAELKRLDQTFADDLDRVQGCIKDLFDIEISELADCLGVLVSKHGQVEEQESGPE